MLHSGHVSAWRVTREFLYADVIERLVQSDFTVNASQRDTIYQRLDQRNDFFNNLRGFLGAYDQDGTFRRPR